MADYTGNILDSDTILVADGATNFKVTAAILAEYINSKTPTGVATNILDSDLFLIADGGTNYKINAADLAEYVNAKAPPAASSDVTWYNGAADGNTSGPVLQIPGSDKIWLANGGNLRVSTDSGATFSAASPNLAVSTWIPGEYNTGMALALGTNGKLYKTADYAASWTEVNGGSASGDTWKSIAYGGSGRWMAVGSNSLDLVYSSDNGDTWTDGTLGLAGSRAIYLGANRHNNVFYVGSSSSSDNAKYTTDGGVTWSDLVHKHASTGSVQFGGVNGEQMLVNGIRNIPGIGKTTAWGIGTPPTSWTYIDPTNGHTSQTWSEVKATWYFYGGSSRSIYKDGSLSVKVGGGGTVLRVAPGLNAYIEDLGLLAGGLPFAFFAPGD